MTEIEAVLNSRPLTYVYEDLDSGFTLTPGHFLATNRKLGLFNSSDADYHCDEDFQPSKDSATKLIEIWKKGQKQVDLFWKVWKEEYLVSLREKLPLEHKHPKSQCLMEPKEGSIVIVKDNNLHRSTWKLGRLIPSSDSRVRSAEILLPGQSIISQAINHLFPLETPVSDKPVLQCCTKRDSSGTLAKEQIEYEDDNIKDRSCEPRKVSIEARKAIYDSFEDDCCTVLFCAPRECHQDSVLSWT